MVGTSVGDGDELCDILGPRGAKMSHTSPPMTVCCGGLASGTSEARRKPVGAEPIWWRIVGSSRACTRGGFQECGEIAAEDLMRRLRRELKRVAHPVKAPAMRSYMKSEMPYLGVNNPIRQRVCQAVFKTVTFPTAESWRNPVPGLWRQAKYREERYAAIDLSGLRRFDSFQTLQALPMYEEMIVTGAWWDYVDELASRRLGPLLRRYPLAMRRKMLAWSQSKGLWKRRSAILCQLGFKLSRTIAPGRGYVADLFGVA